MTLGEILYYTLSLSSILWIVITDANVAELIDDELKTIRMNLSEYMMLCALPTLVLYAMAWIVRVVF